MPPASDSQRVQLRNLLDSRSMMRAQELREAGISAQTIARAVETGEIERISRGVYQKLGSEIEENQILAEAAIRAPKGVIALVSALAFHGLTDQMPRRIWMAIGAFIMKRMITKAIKYHCRISHIRHSSRSNLETTTPSMHR